MDMKKYIKIFVAFIIILLNTYTAYPAESTFKIEDSINEYIEDVLPYSIKKDYYEFSGENISIKSLKELGPKKFLKNCVSYCKNKIKVPFKVMGKVILLGAFLAVINIMTNSFGEKELNKTFNTVTLVCISGAVIAPVINCVKYAAEAIENCNIFISALAPQLGAVLMSMGRPGAAEAYNIGVLGICSLAAGAIRKIGIPLLGVYLAFSLVGTVMDNKELSDLGILVKKTDVWILSFTMFIFSGVLGLQTFIGGAGDNLAVKTVKYAISGFVPIIGSAISEAYNTALGCMKIIKSSLGIFGTVGILFCFMPSLVSVIVWYFICTISSLFMGFMGLSAQGKIFDICCQGLKITMSFLFSYIVMTIISMGMVIFISAGV